MSIMSFTVGSLFDGSGGFPLASRLCGGETKWASEIEPYPIAVSHLHFPNVKHLGDVSKVNGREIDPVDVITFGSPCQDMSIAGERAGINENTRSGLFLQAVRIIKEMRKKTNGAYPTFAVWENVYGRFSSNNGRDFHRVLTELAGVPGAEISIPKPDKWKQSGLIEYGGERPFSIAWRTFDAQFWGVPQRRRRIYLVADFRGLRAGEILFKSEGLSGNTQPSETQGQGSGRLVESGIGTESKSEVTAINDQGGQYMDFSDRVFGTLKRGGRAWRTLYRKE